MTWTRITSWPVTTESRVSVRCEETGQEGWARVEWDQNHARLKGPIVDEVGEEAKVLDHRPTFAG
jgi:hypothetical protein